jgi:2-oxoglutarate dehydrogenase E1 component
MDQQGRKLIVTTDPSLLNAEHAGWLDAQYHAWAADPASVDPAWSSLFAAHGPAPSPPAPLPAPRSLFAGQPADPLEAGRLQALVAQLINAWRVRGHIIAGINPLGASEAPHHPELTLAYYGLTEADLDARVLSFPLFHEPPVTTLRAILTRLQAAYGGSIGAEFMNIQSIEQRRWVQARLEALPHQTALDAAAERRVLRTLCDAENLERMLHQRFPGTKRFSLEGAETLLPLLVMLVERAAQHGVKEIVMGMAHRGRLNVLANLLQKPVGLIFREFEDSRAHTFQGSGDVKYHLGYSADFTTHDGQVVHLSLTPNPSHLEAVDPVVQGRVRAKQDRVGDREHVVGLPLLIHGDAAFAGQGLVAEVLNLSDLKGYRTGGTIHVIVNNQIGFTTTAAEARSTPYATDIARMLAIPILHVNGEDPHAVAAAVQVASDWRQTFHRDVVLDMYCYRKHGHNESDEPAFTQPQMYAAIRARPTPRQVYAERLVAAGALSEAECAAIDQASRQHLQERGEDPNPREGEAKSPFQAAWSGHVGGQIREEAVTAVDRDWLMGLLVRVNTPPPGFTVHPKLRRLLATRLEMARGERPIDWAVAEQAAFATIAAEGRPVRLSGQDSGRGTFSHRHAVIVDVSTGAEWVPVAEVATGPQGRVHIVDSSLSEAGVLGFEWGYTLDTPEGLVMWEAQFGDFANGAQVVVDNFIAASETKWNRLSGLVMLLPHGYEGQGPEHSSARLERYLQLCAEDNLQVANCTTPANFYHLLRRQVVRRVRKPLIVMTPKSLLRHPDVVSTLDDLASGAFQRVIPDVDPAVDASAVRRVVMCSGKVYFDLVAARQATGAFDVALVRVELLHPFPDADLHAILAGYPPDAERVWCQEEPRNMGAWPMFDQFFLDAGIAARFVGRRAAASPATGSHKRHKAEQEALVAEALAR